VDFIGGKALFTGPEGCLIFIIRLAVWKRPDAVGPMRLRPHFFDLGDDLFDRRFEHIGQRIAGLADKARFFRIADLQLVDLALEVRKDWRVFAFFLERHAFQDVSGVGDHRIERIRGGNDAALRRHVDAFEQIVTDSSEAIEARYIGFGVGNIIDAMNVLHEGDRKRHRIVHGRKCISVKAVFKAGERALLQKFKDAVADLHLFAETVIVELRAQAGEIVLGALVLADRFGVGEIVPFAVVGALHSELRLQERAFRQIALKEFFEKRSEAVVLGLRYFCCRRFGFLRQDGRARNQSKRGAGRQYKFHGFQHF